ncbi:Ubiquinone biosynthesis protein coq9, mitochondrial [Cadophora gregata f. sp. sojae]|nr:Ubiquinone biosynthesis protein coq9, mitochondrial [Cadophora gregata f. sp. sojae]
MHHAPPSRPLSLTTDDLTLNSLSTPAGNATIMASKTSRNLVRLRPRRHISSSLSYSTPRTYHSYDHPPPPGPFTPIETSILSASLPHVPTHGFTHTTLALGAKDAGYIDASTNLFPKGAFSLVHYHLVTQRLGLADRTHVFELEGEERPMGVGRKVKALTWERLMANRKVIHRWQEALALMAQPSNLPTAISELSSLADEIWFIAGDKSVNSSWYTKRASLSTIYAATDLFMTTDKSPDFMKTRTFLDRRFADAEIIGKATGSVGQWMGFTAQAGLNVLRSKGVRI